MAISLKNYTFKTHSLVLFVLITIWAWVFYAYILEEVYDNIDDSLENQKEEIIRNSKSDHSILESSEFGVNLYRINPIKASERIEEDIFESRQILMPFDDEIEPYRVLRTFFKDEEGNYYKLEVVASSLEEDELFYKLFQTLLLLYVVLVICIFVINNVVLTRAFKPFKDILNRLTVYRFGEGNAFDPPASEVKEFNELGEHIKRMIERNQVTFVQQREFIENASHELQTPLAIVQNKLDWMIEHEQLTEPQLEQLSGIKKNIMQMSSMNRTLLMLSKIENHQFQATKNICINTIVANLYEDYIEFFEFKGLHTEFIESGKLYLNVNEELITILLSNLLRNAVRYTPAEGAIIVEITPQELFIKNTAKGEALHKEDIFKRFYKKSDSKNASGLGLAIVQSIAKEYEKEFLLNYNFESKMHIFSLNRMN